MVRVLCVCAPGLSQGSLGAAVSVSPVSAQMGAWAEGLFVCLAGCLL